MSEERDSEGKRTGRWRLRERKKGSGRNDEFICNCAAMLRRREAQVLALDKPLRVK